MPRTTRLPEKFARTAAAFALVVAIVSGCAKPAPVKAPPSIYAGAEDVELNFRGRTFVLGDNNEIAEVRPPNWRKDKFLKLPFWFGINILVPGVMAPKEGDFEMLGIRSVAHLARQDPERMYEKMCSLTGQRQDPCVLDTYCAAVAQARDPRLPAVKCQWWYWSRRRKAAARP